LRAFFLRHGESVSNAHPEAVTLPIAEGDRLTERGWEQAREAGRALRSSGATHLLVSPMRRAAETAEAVNESLGLPLEELADIHELREPSSFGGMAPEEQMLTRFSVRMAEHAGDPDHAPDGAESFNQVLARVHRLKSALEARADGDLPLIVTHGLFLRFFFFDSVLGEEFEAATAARFWHLRSVNCGLSTFEQGEHWHAADAETPGWTCVSWMERLRQEPSKPLGAGA
jgi:broad specificity phosphatase PhoE